MTGKFFSLERCKLVLRIIDFLIRWAVLTVVVLCTFHLGLYVFAEINIPLGILVLCMLSFFWLYLLVVFFDSLISPEE